ncbi:hypothetical protein JCM9803A_28510 [Rhodococcus erythropolis]
MHHERQHEVVIGDLKKLGAQRNLDSDIEALGEERIQLRLDSVVCDAFCAEIDRDIFYRADLLVADAVDLGVDRAQNLVAADNVVNCRIQGRQIERTREPNGNRDIVDSRIGVESVEEPHALLRQRQRNPNRTHLRSQRRT